jgi:hypothetical protein
LKKVSGGLEVCANAVKTVKNIFFEKSFLWSGICATNAPKHVSNHSKRLKISFLKKVSGGLEVCANA